eukprot:gene742-806_t
MLKVRVTDDTVSCAAALVAVVNGQVNGTKEHSAAKSSQQMFRIALIGSGISNLIIMAYVPPTQTELAAVKRLKTQLLEKLNGNISPRITDTCILRFYRGVKANEDAALDQLVKHQEWRVANSVDNIDNMTDRFQKILCSGLTSIGTFDKKGRPASFNYAQKHNASDRNIEDFTLFVIYILESLVKLSKPEEERFTIVIDMGGFGLANMDYEGVKILLALLQTNYSDTLETLVVVDAPMLFSACWAIIKPWIDPITAGKVNFIRRSKLTDFFDPESIPVPESGFNSATTSSKIMTNSTRIPAVSTTDDECSSKENGSA